MIAKLLDSARFGIGLDSKMSFENVANFEVLGWDDIKVMTFMMESVTLSDNNV